MLSCALNFYFYSCPLADDRGCCPKRLQATDEKGGFRRFSSALNFKTLILYRHWASGPGLIYRIGNFSFLFFTQTPCKLPDGCQRLVPLHWLSGKGLKSRKSAACPLPEKAASVLLPVLHRLRSTGSVSLPPLQMKIVTQESAWLLVAAPRRISFLS